MSKSLQKGILFAVCILLVCALGVTLFLADGTGMVPSVQEGQASAVARNTATYTHGSNIGRPLPSAYTSVSDGTQLKAAIEANNKDIVLTNDVTLQTIDAFWANNYLWNDNSQCFDSDGNGNTNLKDTGFTHKIYGQGYTIEVQGPHAATGEGMQQNSADTNDYGGLFPKLGNNGAVYDVRIYITKGFSGQTQKTWSGAFGSGNDEWLNVGGIAGSLIGNAVIDNVTVEIASGVKLASYKWSDGSSTSQYVRVGAIAGEINNTASISNVTVINNGRLESGQYTSQAQFYPDSDRYYGAAGNVVGWISNATTSINNVRVEGSGTLYSYYVANIANAIGSTVSVNNFYNNFTGTFDAKDKYSNTLGKGEGATSTLTVTNHYKKGALASTAGTDNTVVATNTLTVPNNLTLYFIPKATQDSDRLGIAFSGTTYSSANDYTVTGLNNAEKTASGGFSAAPSGGTLALGLPVGANNWKTDGTFASITATPKFNPSSYAALTKYDHGYVASDTTSSGTKITQDNFASYFQPGGQANNQSGTYYLTEDVVVTGFTGINFSGTFDGNGHTIFIVANNTTSGSAVGGLVGNMTGGTIKNVRVVILSDLTIGTVNGRGGSVGGLVGAMSGGASLENVQVVIESEAAIRTNMASDTAHSLGGVVGRISGVSSLTNVTLELKGTLAAVGSYTYTGGIAGNIDTIGTGDTITFKNIIVRGNGTFNSRAANANEPPYYAALGILERSSGTNAEVTIDGLIYDANPTLTGTYNGGTDYAMYGIFSNNNWSTGNTSNNVNYHQYVTYSNIFFTENAGTISDDINTAKHNGGNAIIPIGDDTTVKTINNAVTNVTGSAVKAYFMPGDSASENLTLVASASSWSGVSRLQLDGSEPLATSADDGSNKVVNVAKLTAESMSGENLTLSPYNPYTVITASLDNPSKVYDGNPFEAQVSFDLDGGDLSLTEGTEGQYTITYTDGNATGETNANVGDGTYSLTVTLKGTASDGTQYVFDAQGTKTKTFTYTITPLEVTGTWSVNGLKISYGDAAPDYDQYISIKLTNEGTIPDGLTATDITGSGFTSKYTSGTRAGETVTITAGTFTVGSGFTASNYNFSGITGSGSVEVQKREITISAADSDLAVGHIVAIYGGTNYVTSQADLQNLLTWANVSDYVENVYGTDEIGFTITAVAHEQTGDGATYAPGEAVQDGEWAKLPAKDTYYITVTSANNNYTVAADNYFKYQVKPAELSVIGVVWDDTGLDTITYDGNEHTATLQVKGLVGDDTYDSALTVSLTLNSSVVENGLNAGTYTVNVDVNEEDKYYDLGLTGDSDELTLTISPITLTPSPVKGTFTEYTSSNLPTGASFVTSGILAADSGVTVAVTSWVNDPSANVVGSGDYVAVNTYTANLAIKGDTNNNYTLSAETATFTIKPYDLANATITVNTEGITAYTGSEQTVGVTVMAGTADITDLVTITGNKATNAGNSYTVSISSKDSNTTGSNDADTTWSIAKADYNMEGVTFEDDSITYDGESHTLTISEDSLPTGEDGIKVTVEYTAVNGGEVNITNVGSVDIKATFATTSGNYNVPDSMTATLTIEKKEVTITWSVGNIVQGTPAENINALVEHSDNGIVSGEEYTFTVDNDYNAGTAQVGTQVTFSNPRVTFTVGDENNYSITFNPADQIQVSVVLPNITITVTQATVSVDYLQGYTTQEQFMNNFVLGDAAEGSFTITVTNTLQGSQPEQLDARLDVGTYTVEISSTQYIISGTTTYTYVVSAYNLSGATVTVSASDLTYNGSAQTATVTVMASVNGGQEDITSLFSVSGNSQTNAGNHNVQVTARTPGNFTGNFSASSVTNWSIAQLPVQISWSAPGDLVYNGQEHTLTATVNNAANSDDITATVQLTGDNRNVTDDGFTYAVTALAGAVANNYTLAGGTNITSSTLYIKPATINVSGVVWDNASGTTAITYDGAAHNVHIIYTGVVGSEPYSFNIQIQEEGSSVPAPITNAGNYSVAVTADQNNANYTLSFTGSASQNSTLTINPITLTIGNISGTFTEYTSSNLPTGASFVTSGILAADSGTVSVAIASWDNDPADNLVGNGNYVAADTYTANLAIKGDTNNNYTLSADTATFTIKAYNLSQATITVEASGLVYDGTEKTATVTVKAGEADITDLVTITGNTQTNAGNSYTVSISSKDSNTTGSKDADTTWSIAKADYNMDGVTFENDSITYDGASHTLTISEDSLPTGEDGIKVTVTYSAESGYVNIINVGSVKITATFATTSTNYNTPAAKTATLTIEKKAVTVTWKIGDIIQGTDPDKVKATAEVTNNGGILDGDKYTFTVTLPLKDGSGDYTTTTPEGTVISVTPSLKFTDPTDEGNYDITYNPEFREWTVQLPEVKISVTEDPVDKTYAAGFVTEADFLSNFTGTFTATNADADLTSANFDITITKQGEVEPTPVEVGRLDVGTYTVKISAAADSQYTIADGSTLTYTYTVTAEQWTATVAAPEGGLTYNGSDQFSSLVITPGEANNTCDGAPIIAAVVADGEMKNAGTYTVTLQLKTAEGAYTGGNFVLNSGSEDYSAQIKIAKLKVKIEWSAPGDLVYNGQAHTLTATVNNAANSDDITATVQLTGNNINVTDDGFTYTVTALAGAAAENYTIEGVENIAVTYKILPATLTVAEGVATATFGEVRVEEGSLLNAISSKISGAVGEQALAAIVSVSTFNTTVTWNDVAYYTANDSGSDVTVTIKDSNYTFAEGSKTAGITLVINKLQDVINVADEKSATYYDAYQANGGNFFTVSTVSGFPVTIEWKDGEDTPLTAPEVGQPITWEVTTVYADVEVDYSDNEALAANFTAAQPWSSSSGFNLNNRDVTVEVDLQSMDKIYDGNGFENFNVITAFHDDGSDTTPVPQTELEIEVQKGFDGRIDPANAIDAGEYSVYIQGDRLDVTIVYANEKKTFTIEKATLTLTAAEGATLSRDYDGNTTEASTFVSDAYVTVGGYVDDGTAYDLLTATVADGKTIKNADTYTITFALTNADGNYTLAAFDGITFEVTAKELTAVDVKWTAPADNTYSGSAIAPTAAWASGAIVTGDTVNITITISAQDGSEITDNQAINAGSYTAAATIAAGDASRNYKLVADVTYDFTIARKAVTITWTDGGEGNFVYTYDGTAKAPTASVTEGAPEGTFDNINTLVTIGGIADNQAINAGSYTATITKVEFETAYPNYTIAEGSGERQFTIDPATISVSLSASGDNVENNTITLNVSGRVTASAFTSGEATLTEGENTVTITAAAADGATLPDIFFTLNGEPYLGTHYGTKVKGGKLSVATANTNYKITVTQPLTLNITPSIVVQVNEDALKTATYGVSESYKTDDFTSYFSVVDNAGLPVTGGTGVVTITNEEGGNVVQIKNAGTYTITYTYTPADWSGSDEDKPSTSYTFTITPATVTSVVLAEGEPSTYTFGDLRTDSTISVTVTYSDSTTQTLNATFETVSASGNYVSAGQEVTLTLTGDDNENANYMSIGEGGLPQHQVEIRVEKRGITASISYMGAQMVDNILTIEYAGDEVQANISVTLNGMIVGVETSAVVTTQIGNASTYKPELFLEGSYANNYTITNTGDLSVVVTPKEITVNWGESTEFTYNGSAQAPVPTATGTFDGDTVNLGDKVTVTEQGGSGSVTPINAGAYTATVAAFTDGNYKLSENATCEFTIGKGNATLSIANYDNIKSKTYDSQAVNIAPVVSMEGGGQVTADVAVTIMLNGEQVNEVRNAGTYTVTLSIANNNNINDVTSEAFTFTISKASVSVSTTTTDFTYDGNAVDLNAMGASASTIYNNEATLVAKATLNGEPAEMKNAGKYSVTFTLEGEGAGNYEITTTDPVSVTINAKTVTITWGETTFTYNGTAQAPTFTVNNLVEGDVLELTAAITAGTDSALTDDKAVNAGNYTATIAAASISGNYRLEADATTDFAIAPRQVEITWTDETFIYNGTAQAPTFMVNNLVEGDVLELTAAITGNVTDGKAINAGDYTATIAAFTQGNYTLKEASTKTFTIGKADLTLDPASVTFSEKDAGSLADYSQSSYEATIKETINVTGVAGKIADYTVTTEAKFDGTTGYLVTDGENAGTYTFTITAGDNYNTATYTVTVTAQQTITITATPSSGTYTGSEITFEYAPSDSSVDISGLTITVATVNGSADGAVLNAGSYTVTFTVNNSDEADYWYEVRDWTGTIAAAEVTVTEATLSAIYGEVYTAEATGVAVQNVNGWSVATFNGTPVEATVAIDQTAAAAALPGETIYLSASETAYNVIITLTSDNFKFADTVSVSGNSKQMATTLTVEKKELDVTTPTDLESLTYTSEGVVIEIADISEDIVGSDNVTVTIMVDGEPYEPGVTVLSAGEHTITYAISGNGNYNYAISADSAAEQTFTIAPKAASDSITVSGETVESGGTVEITTGENLRVDTAINNYIAQNGVAEGEYTVTATDSQGNEVDIDRVSSWAPGDYTISVNLGENFSGGEMTFTISVAEGTTTEIPDPPTTPSTPIVDDGGSGNNWLFPLIIAIECVIALALIAAIVITAIKRSKNA